MQLLILFPSLSCYHVHCADHLEVQVLHCDGLLIPGERTRKFSSLYPSCMAGQGAGVLKIVYSSCFFSHLRCRNPWDDSVSPPTPPTPLEVYSSWIPECVAQGCHSTRYWCLDTYDNTTHPHVKSRNVPDVPEPRPPTQQPVVFCPIAGIAFPAVFDPE